jgi:2-hydroxychromene-2-carboxylate isomerase
MPLKIDLFWSFRSPYSYLAAQRLAGLRQSYAFEVDVRIVRPLAVRDPEFFERGDPRWLHYVLVDAPREADRMGVPMTAPNPDPIEQDLTTRAIAAEQPRITRLNRFGVRACELGDGLAYIAAASRRIWGADPGQVPWTDPGALDEAAQVAGVDPDRLEADIQTDAARLDAVLVANEADQDAAGHWGVPLMVFQGEPFFGQDRIDTLLWRMRTAGLAARA